MADQVLSGSEIEPEINVPVSVTDSNATSVRQVYLITYSQADLSLFSTRQSFARCIVDALENSGVNVNQWVSCRQKHQDDGAHYHAHGSKAQAYMALAGI